jgi:hypothetical protein
MPQLLAGSAAFVLVAVLWLLGRRPSKTLLRSTDAGSVAAINRAQLGLVQSDDSALPESSLDATAEISEAAPAPLFSRPVGTAARLALTKELCRAMDQGGPDERLLAVERAGLWGHRSVLSVLRRGLRDSDRRVVLAAAAGLERQRGATRPSPSQQARPPRNVARMR